MTGFAALVSSTFLIRELGMPDANIVDVVIVRVGAFYALHPLYALGGYDLIMLELILSYLVLLATKHGVVRVGLNQPSRVGPNQPISVKSN